MSNPLECRKFERVNVKCFLTHIRSDLNGEKINGFSKDLSCGGIMFASSVKYSPEDTVQLEIKLSENTIAVSAQAIRVQDLDNDMYGVGARFLWQDRGRQEALEEFVNKQLKGRKAFFS